MKKIIISLLALTIAYACAVAQKLTSQVGTVPGSYNFWFYSPADTAAVKSPKPLFIFLHGASLCGNNLDRVRRYGTLDAIEKGRELNAYVIAPQNPGGAWKPEKVIKLLDWAKENYSLDTARVYILGMSLGGYGTLDVAACYPDKFAAAIAVCGGASTSNLAGLNEMPLWIIHGTADRAVSIRESDKVVAAMRNSGPTDRLIYNRVPGMNHGRPARLFYMPEIYDWLLSHSLDDPDRKVNDAFDIDNSVLQKAYNGLDLSRGKTKAGRKSRSAVKSKSKKYRRGKSHSRKRGKSRASRHRG